MAVYGTLKIQAIIISRRRVVSRILPNEANTENVLWQMQCLCSDVQYLVAWQRRQDLSRFWIRAVQTWLVPQLSTDSSSSAWWRAVLPGIHYTRPICQTYWLYHWQYHSTMEPFYFVTTVSIKYRFAFLSVLWWAKLTTVGLTSVVCINKRISSAEIQQLKRERKYKISTVI
jgi:hypothetical protein